MKPSALFSNSLRSNENNLIYFLKQLGNKGKRKLQLLRRVFGLWTGRLLWAINQVQGELRTAIWRALSYFVENCSLTALKNRRRFWSRVILFPKINRYINIFIRVLCVKKKFDKKFSKCSKWQLGGLYKTLF